MVKEVNVETEQKILSAARKVLIAKGKDGARMQEIANEAGVNKALLHYYFRSKEKLYLKVLEGVVKQILDSVIMKIDPEASIQQFLKGFVTNHFHFIKNNLPLIHFFLGEMGVNREQLAGVMKQHLTINKLPVHRMLAKKIETAVDKDEIIPIEPASLIINVLSLNVFFFIASPVVHIILETPEEKQKALLEDRAEHVYQFIWNSIRKK